MRMLHHRRPAFTLVEMLIVIALILIITAIGILAVPSAQDRNMQTAADQIQGWLLKAKQIAKRDRMPTGLQIEFNQTGAPDPNTGVAPSEAVQCYYIQQPDDFAVAGSFCSCPGPVQLTTVAQAAQYGLVKGQYIFVVSFTGTAAAPVDLNAAGVAPGDYLEVYRGGGAYKILALVPPKTANLPWTQCVIAPANPSDPTTGPPPFSTSAAASVAPLVQVFEYRIRRQPVRLLGEEVLTLPNGVVIDNTTWTDTTGTFNPPTQNKCQNIPVRTVTVAGATSSYYEILFSPQGGLVGRGSGTDAIAILWLSNTSKKNTPPLLVAVQAHTGFIQVQQLNGGSEPFNSFSANPYQFCLDGRASGL